MVNVDVNISVGAAGLNATKESGGGGESWLVAMAKALGTMLGEKAGNMVQTSKEMEKYSGSDSKEDAQKFSELQTKFQAESQMFSMLSNTISTALKSIGEGLTANARKQ
ncbi:hypothetical protein [Luteimonas sp. 3794]|uniref:hypothetical protein n=1 Tax=Luteimonas sp. 3794 TaxID=2817730 RepID=UPI00285974D2|nr:hypothetical protein [Luteimonas sp. 3794]MDR6993155.1 hypothetical protein [Luteimonas sp. 3794]